MSGGDRYRGFVFVPADLLEDVDLPMEVRKEILFLHARVADLDHWRLLDIPWNAPPERVRDAYLAKVKVVHPDRYGGKRLGSYKTRMEVLVRRLTEARDLLVDASRREAYVRQTAPPDDFARIEARKLLDEQRSVERRARLARQNPLVLRATQVSDLMARAREAFEEGRWQQAANDFNTVAAMDPRNEEAKLLGEEARRKALAEKAADDYEEGLKAELAGQGAAARAAFRAALERDPGNPRYAVALSRTALARGDLETARQTAEAAVRAAPRNGAAHEALAAALAAQGQNKDARRTAERAVELDPSLEQARALLKKLRWSLF